MKNGILKAFKWLLSSFDNSTPGASSRKLSAFALMVCVAYLHLKYVTNSNAFDFLVADLCAIFLFLGIVTVQNIIDLRHSRK